MFLFTKEMADILRRIRVKANSTQREVASRDKRLTKGDLEENSGRFWVEIYFNPFNLLMMESLWNNVKL